MARQVFAPSPVLLLVALVGAVSTFATIGCRTTAGTATVASSDRSWLGDVSALAEDARLDEAAAALCGRDTDAIIDDDIRAAARVWEGRVVAVMEESRVSAASAATALFADLGLTHLGVAEGATPRGTPCVVVVGSRQGLEVRRLPQSYRSDPKVPATMTVSISPRRQGTLYVQGADGFVDRIPLEGHGRDQERTLPFRREGRQVLEIIVDDLDNHGQPRGNIEVAVLWPFVRGGISPAPPMPQVLFPDEGHSDQALSYRAETLVQRLRNEMLLEPLTISPPLTTLAGHRLGVVKDAATLGHRLEGQDPRAALHTLFGNEPRAAFVRLGEVQGRGSTLADAWQALVDSPAHRYELVSLGVTHMGVQVARAKDALGRTTTTLEILLGRRPPVRTVEEVQANLVARTNTARTTRGFDALKVSDTLENAARRLANRMMETRTVDDTLLGGPVGQVALEADASMVKVTPLVARIDDPAQLGAFAPLMDIDSRAMGMGIALHPEDGVYYVVLLVGQ